MNKNRKETVMPTKFFQDRKNNVGSGPAGTVIG